MVSVSATSQKLAQAEFSAELRQEGVAQCSVKPESGKFLFISSWVVKASKYGRACRMLLANFAWLACEVKVMSQSQVSVASVRLLVHVDCRKGL